MWFSLANNIVDLRYKFSTSPYSIPLGLNAAKGAVEIIMKNFPPPYHLMVSGGVDSQAMLQSWIEFGSNWKAWHITYNGNLNSHDTDTINELIDKWQITIHKKDFDVINCHLTEHNKLARIWQCPSPQITSYISMTEDFDGTVIMGGCLLGDKSFYFDNSQHALLKVAEVRKNFIPLFLLSTPELAYSAVHGNLINNLENKFIENNYEIKVKTYKQLGFDIIPQTRKYTGFEFVKDYWDEKFRKDIPPIMRLKYARKPSKRAHDILLRYPYEDLFPEPDWQFLMNDNSYYLD